VTTKESVKMISDFLSNHNDIKLYFKLGVRTAVYDRANGDKQIVMGQGKTNGVGMTRAQQQKSLSDFRSGETNLYSMMYSAMNLTLLQFDCYECSGRRDGRAQLQLR
jgi:hypothetical protein